MRKGDLIKAMKDEKFRDGLSAADQSMMPSPAGIIELSDSDMELVVGGLVQQTGTGGAGCSCVKTNTAISGAGSCNCTCPDDPAPADPIIIAERKSA